jgi:amidase
MSKIIAPFPELEETTISELQDAMSSGHLSAQKIVEMYLTRIEALDRIGPEIRSIIEINPESIVIAEALDRERAVSGSRGPLHGIPVLLKDNIGTADLMETTAGSFALLGSRPRRDAFVAERLRKAGAVLIGKANMSEWANFRSTRSSSGWSARGGQGRNPYSLDRSPRGSSSGPASAVAANLAAASVGTETDGSILSPSSANCVVGIKPTVGLTSRSGVIPIAQSLDTVGSIGRTVTDAVAVLEAIMGVDSQDKVSISSSGRQFHNYRGLLSADGMRGARIGVAREVYFGYCERTDVIANAAVDTMRSLGAIIIDPADIPTAKQISQSEAELDVLLYEFKAGLNAYLESLGSSAQLKTLEELIAFNNEHAEQEMPYFGQELMILAQSKGPLTEQTYLWALMEIHRLSRREGIDSVMERYQLDALVMPTAGPPAKIDLIYGDRSSGSCAQPAALAGYPAITVPAGYTFGLPAGITFMGRAFSEPKLIQLAYAFEQATKIRHPPEYVTSILE